MQRIGLLIIGVAIGTALLVWWLSRIDEVAARAEETRSTSPVAPVMPVESAATAETALQEIRIEGHVWNSLDEGVNRAEVDFERGGILTTLKTGEDGRFVFTSALSGRWRVVGVRAAGFGSLEGEQAEVEMAAGGSIAGLSFVLWPAGALRGRVVDSHGKVLEGAEVRLVGIEVEFAGRTMTGPATRTDALGEFAVQLSGGERFSVSHACCLPALIAPVAGTQVLVVTLEPRDTPVPQTSFIGLVVDEDGRPVAGAVAEGVAISTLLPVAQSFSFRTDSAGRFSVEVAAGASIELEVHIGDMTSGELELPGHSEARIVLLSHDGTISGRVTDTGGRPVTDFTVTISSKWFGKNVDVNSADGTWRVEHVPRMPWGIVEVSAVGFLPPSRNPISVGRGEDVTEVDFVVERGRSISGVVFDQETARPLSGALVRPVRDFDTRGRGKGGVRTDDQGRFSVEGISAGRLELRATRAGYQSHGVAVGADDRDVRIGLSASERDGKQTEYEGIGMRFGNEAQPDAGSGYRVAAVHPEGGARLAGVEVGDEILAAGGVRASSVPTAEFLLQIKGTAGSAVTLSVRREGREFDLHAVRRRLPLQW